MFSSENYEKPVTFMNFTLCIVGKLYWCLPYLRLVQLPSSGGTCMMSLFCRSRVDNLSSSLRRTGSMAPTWLLLIKIVSSVKMRYSTSGKDLNLRKIKQINRIWIRIVLFSAHAAKLFGNENSLYSRCIYGKTFRNMATEEHVNIFKYLLIKWQYDAPQLSESFQLHWQWCQQITSREKSNYIGDISAVRSH